MMNLLSAATTMWRRRRKETQIKTKEIDENGLCLRDKE
jgi:hypothetical protein